MLHLSARQSEPPERSSDESLAALSSRASSKGSAFASKGSTVTAEAASASWDRSKARASAAGDIGSAMACVYEGPRRCAAHRRETSSPSPSSLDALASLRPEAAEALVDGRPIYSTIADSVLVVAFNGSAESPALAGDQIPRGWSSLVSSAKSPRVARTLARDVSLGPRTRSPALLEPLAGESGDYGLWAPAWRGDGREPSPSWNPEDWS